MKKKIFLGIKIVIVIAMLVLSFVLFNSVRTLDMLPNKYLYLIGGILGGINIIGAVTLFIKKWYTYVISGLFYLILIVTSVVGISVGDTANEFLDKAFNTYKEETATFYIMVKSKSSYKKLSDLDGKEVQYYTFYDNQEDMLNEVKSVIKAPVLKPHDDLFDCFINFLVYDYGALVIDEGYLDVLSEDYKNLDTRLKVLHTFEVKYKVLVDENGNPVNKEEDKDKVVTQKYKDINKGDNINIYISGSDSRSNKIYNKTRSDVNMILTINKKTKTILLTSIPRDYYVQVHGQTGLKDKLTHAGIYGLDRSKQTVEDLFQIDIDYSVKVGMSAVPEVVDLVGGVEIYSDTEFDSFHMPGWHVKKGYNHMDGKKALAYARERYAYASGDRHRIKNQQQVLEGVLVKVLGDKSLLLKYDKLLDSLSKMYITDIPRDVISEYVKMQLDDMSKWTFISQSVDGKGSMEHTYTAPKSNRYVMIPNQDTVDAARLKIKQVLEAK